MIRHKKRDKDVVPNVKRALPSRPDGPDGIKKEFWALVEGQKRQLVPQISVWKQSLKCVTKIRNYLH